jgi:alanine racemase
MNEDPDAAGLEPALVLSSYVAAVKRAEPGESAGYGRRFIADRATWIATLPIGYADGVRRALSNNCDVLIGGRRYPLVGTVSMDNITVDLGPAGSDPVVPVGTEAILIGRSGSERQTVEDLANRLGTINHEVLCGISARVPRQYHRDGAPGA